MLVTKKTNYQSAKVNEQKVLRVSHLWLWSLMQDVIVGWWGSWMFPQHGTVGKFIIDFLGNWYISQQHELLHHGVGLPDNQQRLFNFYLHNINPGKVQRKAEGKKLLSEATYKSSFAWRSMGSWVSLSMWKRTSNEDNVRALRGNPKLIPLIYNYYIKEKTAMAKIKVSFSILSFGLTHFQSSVS